jgi:hypothetical protein
MPELLAKLNVKREQGKIAGITVYVITPETLPPENRDRLLVHVHGGGYVLGPGLNLNRVRHSSKRQKIRLAHLLPRSPLRRKRSVSLSEIAFQPRRCRQGLCLAC